MQRRSSMSNKLGTSTIYGNILPNFNQLLKIYNKPLTKEMKHRLRVLDYLRGPAKNNITLTARHFGCTRGYIYKWQKRFNKGKGTGKIEALRSRSTRPKHTRSVQYSEEVVSIIRKIRKEYPTFSAVKISVLLFRDYGIQLSSSTVGRIIKKFNLFFSKVVQIRKDLSNASKRGWQSRKAKHRMKYYMQPEKPRHIIEFDMKHIMNGSSRQYALCAIDTFTKEALIHISSSCSSLQGAIALQKVLDRFGENIIIVCDNGSENFGESFKLLEEKGVCQIFTRPHTPKDKPHIENFIGKYQKECLNESENRYYTVQERQEEANKWLNDWHFYRPHQALNYLTPAEYCVIMGITILPIKSVHDVVI